MEWFKGKDSFHGFGPVFANSITRELIMKNGSLISLPPPAVAQIPFFLEPVPASLILRAKKKRKKKENGKKI